MLQYYNNIIPSQVIQNTYASRYEGISSNVFLYSISIDSHFLLFDKK